MEEEYKHLDFTRLQKLSSVLSNFRADEKFEDKINLFITVPHEYYKNIDSELMKLNKMKEPNKDSYFVVNIDELTNVIISDSGSLTDEEK